MTKYRYGTPLRTLSVFVSPTTPIVISDTDQSRIDSGHQELITSSSQTLPAEVHENHHLQESKAGRTVLLEYPAAERYSSHLEASTETKDSSVELERAGRLPPEESSENDVSQDFDAREKARSNYTTIEFTTDLKAPVESKDSNVHPEPACTERREFSEDRSTEASNRDCDLQAAVKSGRHINGEQQEVEEDFYADERTILLEIDISEFYYDKEKGILLKILSTTPEATTLPELLLSSADKQPQSGDSTPTCSTPIATEPQVEEIRPTVRIPDGPFVTRTSDLNAIFPPTPEALSIWEYPAYIQRARRALPESWETPNKNKPFVYPPGKPAPYLDPALRGKKKNEYDLYGEYYGYCGYGAYTGYMFHPDSDCGSDFEEEECVLGAADVYREGDLVNGDASRPPRHPSPEVEASIPNHDSVPNRMEMCFSDFAFTQPPVEPAFPTLLKNRLLEWLDGISAPQLDRLQLNETQGKSGEAMRSEGGDREGGRQEGRLDKVKERYGGGTEGHIAIELSEEIDRGKVGKVRVRRAPVTVGYEHLIEEEENVLTCQGCQDRTNNMCLYCNRCHASCCIHQVTFDMIQEAT